MTESLRVAVAEDYLPLRLCVCELLLAMGATLVEVTNAHELWAALERQCFDVVITDVRMSGTSGIEVLHRRRALGDPTPFIVMSGAPLGIDARLSDVQAVVLLEKPFHEEDFRAAVHRAVAMRAA